jgi:hypothetical protein
MIVTAPANQGQVFERNDGGLEETRDFLGVITDEGRLRPEILGDERSFLPGIDFAVEKATR